MARLPRLALDAHPHWLIQRGHNASPVFVDSVDRRVYLEALREASAAAQVRLHAYALLDNEVHLMATPTQASNLSRMMQSLGRRYVSAHHRRHGGSGTLWEGRFRCAVVEPGGFALEVLALIDALPGDSAPPDQSSQAHRSGGPAQPMLLDPPEYWPLGNTPFERQLAWRERLIEGQGSARATQLLTTALGGWALGSAAFAARVAEQAQRAASPRPRGRPRRALASR